MTTPKVLSAVLIATAILATPAFARASHVSERPLTEDVNPSAFPSARYTNGQAHFSAPHVSAFHSSPPDGENCDVGDNPEIC
jgi:hypothetical protein